MKRKDKKTRKAIARMIHPWYPKSHLKHCTASKKDRFENKILYYLFDDKSKLYLKHWTKDVVFRTHKIEEARRNDPTFTNQFIRHRGYTGAWRPIRVGK